MRADQPRRWRALLEAWAAAVVDSDWPAPPSYDGPDLQIGGVVDDSRQVRPGDVFVVRVRPVSDAHTFIPQAIEAGAAMIVAQKPADELGIAVPEGVVYWTVPDTAVAYAFLAATWYGFPAQELVVVGITGTDGKTTTANLLFEILRTGGVPAGLLSTTRAVIGDVEEPLALHVTTPEAPVVQRHLRRMADAGLTHVVVEATSHGLDQERVGAIGFDLAIVTYIGHEHLDYHGSREAYVAAKARLFHNLGQTYPTTGPHAACVAKQAQPRVAILNRDDSSYEALAPIVEDRHLTYAIDHVTGVDFGALEISTSANKTTFQLRRGWETFDIASPMVGYFNVYNMLAAAGAAFALGMDGETIRRGLNAMSGIVGRMERIDGGQPFTVIVDFAHTPDGLKEALLTCRRILEEAGRSGRLLALFGSAGKRDVAKRRLMAEISARLADFTILTAEDPRTESLDEILSTMATGARAEGGIEGENFWRVRDRGQAIYFGLSLAQPGDLLIICGKAHEQSMCFGTTEYPWDDIQATMTALDRFLAGEPMPDLGLPTFDPHWTAGQTE